MSKFKDWVMDAQEESVMVKVKRHGVKMTYNKRNPVAQEVRTEKYKHKVVPDKHKERKEEDKWKEMISYLKSLS
tara:strand:- start:349 stop:570 length:222 start_codon:yes stop_codon:yes gene_type:complete